MENLEKWLSPEAMAFMLDTPKLSGFHVPFVDGVYSVTTSKRWYVAYTNPKCEDRAARGFEAKGWRHYVPMLTEWARQTRWERASGAPKRKVSRPLFTRYVPVELPAAGGRVPFGAARLIDGVREFVGTPDGPLAISEAIVEAIKAREAAGHFDATVKPDRRLPEWAAVGAEARITEGPFAGFVGLVEQCLGDRIKISVMGTKIDIDVNGLATI